MSVRYVEKIINFFYHTMMIQNPLFNTSSSSLIDFRKKKIRIKMFFFFASLIWAGDRRLDPFQFNLCVWDLEGIDPSYTHRSVLKDEDTRDKEENDIAQIMYSSLSTCDMFVLPGLRNHTTAKNLVAHMEDHSFKDFIPYPIEGRYDSTILSRIDLDNTADFQPNEFDYPIKNSKCGFTGSGHAMMNMSFYGTLSFHEPVPLTHVFSVRLKSQNTPEACAFREAQAAKICEIVSQLSPKDHIYVAGSFEANPEDPYHSVLENCGLIDTWYLANKGTYTRKNATDETEYFYDTIWVNQAVKNDKYLDTMNVITDKNSKLLSELQISTTLKTMPFTLYTHQPLTPKWKKFEIIFSSCIVSVSILFFVWLMLFSREKKPENAYDHMK
ncbi:hypothetical protein TRFO_39985 [Tritrichomonas foetus]|uniref:Endonuclease/Exonuclease/phosphatase family protein n=1 Tax=Tritrichomonas foetus TaxID=1144522 RepID=A0A1J4J8J1_9EUKA|nr:hypothetical protein TRFO_39985 [Tritrichomonas foetus]|eukprot:OHS93717.1 hypothetical protein TRFO_39985 [Tritrichomonas foetus]